jgi:hypothetical protein
MSGVSRAASAPGVSVYEGGPSTTTHRIRIDHLQLAPPSAVSGSLARAELLNEPFIGRVAATPLGLAQRADEVEPHGDDHLLLCRLALERRHSGVRLFSPQLLQPLRRGGNKPLIDRVVCFDLA